MMEEAGFVYWKKSLIKKPWEGASIYAWRPLLLSPRFCFQVHLFIIGVFGAFVVLHDIIWFSWLYRFNGTIF
jgi:hypothetical protein